MNSDSAKKRLPGPDIVRVTAAFFVVAVHFFIKCGYYGTSLTTPLLFFMTAERWLFMCCVPLYMILTGYFKCNKTADKSHYLSLIPIGVAYLFFSVIKIIVSNYYYGHTYGIRESMQVLGNYTAAWYVGFYFSLMAIAPFLNRLWHALRSRREQHILLISLVFVSTLYPLFSLPAASESVFVSVTGSLLEFAAPSYWQMLYPLLYYFLGCYFREHKIKLNKFLLIAVILVTVFINAAISYMYADGSNFMWHILGTVDSGYNCITVAICSASVFLLLYDIDIKNKKVCFLLEKAASVSFEIYLASAVFEIIIFDKVNRMFFTIEDYAILFFILVPLNYILSLIFSLLYKKIYSLIAGMIRHKSMPVKRSE